MAKTLLGVRIENTKAVQKRLEKFGPAAKKALGAAMFKEMRMVEDDARKNAPADLGNLQNSGVTNIPFDDGTLIVVETRFGGPSAPYAEFVEEGRPPGGKWPPVGALEGWGQRKLHQSGLDFVLRRKIGEVGIDPKPFLVPAFEKRVKGMPRRLSADMFRRLKAQGLVGTK